ncbi:MAG: putative peptidoglycan lipid II flippase [Oceanicoccus sp.]
MSQPPVSSQTGTPGLFKSSLVVSLMTVLSRVLGLTRDVVVANFIGATVAADAFFLAFKIPNFMRRLFAEGAFSQAFVPVLSEYRTTRPHDAVQALVNRVAGVLGGTLLLVTGLAVMGAPLLTAIFAPGFFLDDDPSRFQLASEMIRITFPYLLLISMTGFCGAVLNSYGRFAVPAFTPVLLNISLITSALVVAPLFDVPAFALAWGVLAAGFIQLTFQIPFMVGIRLSPKPVWDLGDEGVRRILTLMGPAIFGVSVSQINLMLDTILASFLPIGSISWLYYSDRLVELPLGVFAIAISTVILPSLSRQQAASSTDSFRRTMDWAIRMVLFISIPAGFALIVLAKPILMTLFQYGALTLHDVSMASMSLQAYATGLVAFMLIKVLAPGYFSRQDTKTPVSIGVKAMFANMVLNILFVVPLHHFWQLGHIGLALATSIAACLNAGLLYIGLKKQGVYSALPGMAGFIVKVFVSSVLMAILLYEMTPAAAHWIGWNWWERSLNIGWLCFAGVLTYFTTLALLGVRLSNFRVNLANRE